MFAGYALTNAIEILFHELPVTKEQTRAFDWRGIAPGRERISRGVHRSIDMFLCAGRHFGDDFTARRIENRRAGDAGDFAPFAADKCRTTLHAPDYSRASAFDCFTKSSPLHSLSALTIFFASAAALSLSLRSFCMRTSSACVVK